MSSTALKIKRFKLSHELVKSWDYLPVMNRADTTRNADNLCIEHVSVLNFYVLLCFSPLRSHAQCRYPEKEQNLKIKKVLNVLRFEGYHGFIYSLYYLFTHKTQIKSMYITKKKNHRIPVVN